MVVLSGEGERRGDPWRLASRFSTTVAYRAVWQACWPISTNVLNELWCHRTKVLSRRSGPRVEIDA